MIEVILKGIVTGFILTIMIGPVFFLLLETSIKKGARSAIAFDLGVLISDVVYILIAYVFYSEVAVLTQGENQGILKLIGGSLFLIYGIVTFFKKPKKTGNDKVGNALKKTSDYPLLALKGFLLNFANPMVIFYWFSVITFGAKSSPESTDHNEYILVYLATILITFFSFDLLKIFGAKLLRPLVTDRVLVGLNHLIGIVFVIFGVFLIVQGTMLKA